MTNGQSRTPTRVATDRGASIDHSIVFANNRNGLPLPVYLRRPKHTGLGNTSSERVPALRAEHNAGSPERWIAHARMRRCRIDSC